MRCDKCWQACVLHNFVRSLYYLLIILNYPSHQGVSLLVLFFSQLPICSCGLETLAFSLFVLLWFAKASIQAVSTDILYVAFVVQI